jgi:peptidoglycan/xylan/chitin deacetylase (PgdA/CDA1 family)
MQQRFRQSLPVIMHHSVSEDASRISVTPAVFEAQCRDLAQRGWFGVSLREAEDFLINGAPLPKKAFLMTFDDGFLDNYLHAWPIMRKYGHKGVIFAVADRISDAQRELAARRPSDGKAVRPTLDDVWNKRCAPEDLPAEDKPLHRDAFGYAVRRDLFFTWDEARLMEESGTMAIAAHSLRHESVFAGPNFSVFVQPGDCARVFTNTVIPSIWGMPLFERMPELAARRAFIPSPELIEAVSGLVPQETEGARAFFSSAANVGRLKALVGTRGQDLGEYESRESQIARLRAVMVENQAVLARELGRTIRSFCWPWGVFCDAAREQGLAAGFEVFYTTRPGINLPARPLAVHRFKVKNRVDAWLRRRMLIYSRPWLGALYTKMRI